MEKNNQFGICPYLTSQKLLCGKSGTTAGRNFFPPR